MKYTSTLYLLVFLPFILSLYFFLPQRHRWKLLLASSYLFFMLLSGVLVFYLIFSTISIHGIGMWLANCDEASLLQSGGGSDLAKARLACERKKRAIVCYGVVIHIGLLLILKYFGFFGGVLEFLLGKLSLDIEIPKIPFLSLGIPIGLSFFTLQAVSYIADVYWQRIKADANLGRLALYMAFFPAIVEGPICRYSQTAEALYAGKPLKYRKLAFGAQRMLWGLFKKLVIADRLDVLVGKVFSGYSKYSGLIVLLGAVLYTFQLYADFSGCIDITIGAAEMFGVTLPENFRQPFFSRTASEFWRRWHITLGSWLKDYVFYPLSLNRTVKALGKLVKKRFGRHQGQILQTLLPLFAVWFCNGLWHGVGWHFLFFGMYYFVLILLGNLSDPAIKRLAEFLHLNREGVLWRGVQTIKMAVIIVTGELFFRASGLGIALRMFASIFTGWKNNASNYGKLLQLGLDRSDFFAVAAGAVIMLFVGLVHEKGISIRAKVADLWLPLRWAIYLSAILIVVLFGAYGVGYLPVNPLYAGY